MSSWNLARKLKETSLSSAFSRPSSSSSATITPNTVKSSKVDDDANSSLSPVPSTEDVVVNSACISSPSFRALPSVTTLAPDQASRRRSSSISKRSHKSTASTSTIPSTLTTTPLPPSRLSSSSFISESRDTGSSSSLVRNPDSPVYNDPKSTTSTIKPGRLTVTIRSVSGFTIPEEVMSSLSPPANNMPAKTGSRLSSFFSSIGGSRSSANPSPPARGNKNSSSLPSPPVFAVVEFDKTELVLDATAGTVENPIWDTITDFDVSRSQILSIEFFAKLPKSIVNDKNSNDSIQQLPTDVSPSSKKKQYQGVFLGSCQVGPLDQHLNKSGTITILDGKIPLQLGSPVSRLSLSIKYRSNQNHRPLTIEDFDLLKVIGKGSFGKVMQVRKRDTQRIYALKTIRKAHIISRSEVTHTLAERTVLAQIDNPFIVPLKFSFQSPDKLYLGLAFINGGELFHHLQCEGKFDLNRSRFYAAELLCALECLHEYNVIYRDLKPENILLDYTGHIALCDFGLCKLNMEAADKTNTFCGTPEYLSPEILLGTGYTKAVDWWTLGVLLYEMLTGLPPFYDENVPEMYRKILEDPLRFPDDMDREARSLLTGLLQRDPDQRTGSYGAQEIKSHPFFVQIDWKRLMAKKYKAPFKPAVQSAIDTSNFDDEFTSEVPADSVVEGSGRLSDSIQRQFGGWSFTDNN
ncbi:kinase-like protein [Nadsonia fulvescens var. elongata DSM 6958]|uniref:non-specific serine/threonine protein kinase n=1 Tax=Nadsonia fulvescens var. elongata DSM 6958 TaxID=857566 RepID=A0A1E3PJ30_9ASCO|nr:kinase-like protein [Nadsonia fulvescens var. elongata DSM 6958]